MFSSVKTPFQSWREEYVEVYTDDRVPVDYKEIGHQWKHGSESADIRRRHMTIRWLFDIKRFARRVVADLPETLEPGFERTYRRDSGILTKAYTVITPDIILPSVFHGGKYFGLVRLPDTISPKGACVLSDVYGRSWVIALALNVLPKGTNESVVDERMSLVHMVPEGTPYKEAPALILDARMKGLKRVWCNHYSPLLK